MIDLCDVFNRCFECNEELSTHCNKKALAQTLDFLQKHSAKTTSGTVVTIRQSAFETKECCCVQFSAV